MTSRAGRALGVALLLVGVVSATAVAAPPTSNNGKTLAYKTPGGFCDRSQPLTARQQDLSLRFAAVVRDELDTADASTALISRSGLDLARFHIRYSHAAVAWREPTGAWSARQLYYACDERRPRLYDQGLPGFAMGIDDPALGFVAIVRLPGDAGDALRRAALDAPLALHLLAARYSANAYPFSTRYQNCNQWVAELLAVAWGGLPDGDALRERAQRWLQDAGYAPAPVDVDSHALMFAATFVPFIHTDDHPLDDRYAMKLQISLPASLETFVRDRLNSAERIEICHTTDRVVVHRGWTPVAEGCVATGDDRVIVID